MIKLIIISVFSCMALSACTCDTRYISHEPTDASVADSTADAVPCNDQ